MDCRTLLQLYEIDKERRAAILKAQQQAFLICHRTQQRPLIHYGSRLLIAFGLALQRYGQALNRRAESSQGTWTATQQELQQSR